MRSAFYDEIGKLDAATRFQLAQDLLDSVASETFAAPLTEEQRTELRARLTHHRLHPDERQRYAGRDQSQARHGVLRYTVRYKAAADAEVVDAITWYAQPEINQASAFLREPERTGAHLAANPELYQRVEDDMRRAALRRFPILSSTRVMR